MSEWDARYERPGFFYGEAPNDFLAEMAHRLPPHGDVVSIGEGEGRNAVFLASLGHHVTGVDASAVGLAKARALAVERGVAIATTHAELDAFDFGVGRWDGVVAIWCHLPPDVRRAVHRRCAAGLKPGGLLLLEAYRPAQLEYRTGGPAVADLLYSLADLAKDFEGLELVHAVETLRDVREGRAHDGMSAVVQVVARRAAAAPGAAA